MNANPETGLPRPDQGLARIMRRIVKEFQRVRPNLRRLEQRIRGWRKSLPNYLKRRKIAFAYANFDVASALQECQRQPLYSLIVPVYKTDLRWLRRCLESVRGQLYRNWELIIVDDGSQMPSLTAELARWKSKDRRISVFSLATNRGIANATNHGLAQARGEFVGFLDHDDELTPDALLWMVLRRNRHPNGRWFYSDEAILESNGNYGGRFHRKPAYSWELLLSVMYTCHFSVYERRLIDLVGGCRSEMDGAQDHDLALRISDYVLPSEVIHIPEMLYLWRAIPESTACTLEAKPGAAGAALRTVKSAIERRELPIDVIVDSKVGTHFHFRLRHRKTPKVAILIPTRNAAEMVERCIESMMAQTRYPNYEIVVIDNQSDDQQLANYLAKLSQRAAARTIPYDRPFNHSDMHNLVVDQLDAELIVLANNDVFDFSSEWLEQLVATTQLDDSIAGAGAKLFYPDGTVQHAGIMIGLAGGLAANVGCGLPGDAPGYMGRARMLQGMAGVTGALMIVKKSVYLEVGGFDAERYPSSYNDVDLWMRITAAGYRCVFNPEVTASHDESKTRGFSLNEAEYQRRLKEDVKRQNYRDPFWNLSLFDNTSELGRGERTADWALLKLARLREEVLALKEQNLSTIDPIQRPTFILPEESSRRAA